MSLDATLKLHAWLSPAFPTGGFAYSHGLEWAVEGGDVRDEATLRTWMDDILRVGAGRTDAILLRLAHRAADGSAVASLGRAIAGARERLLETTGQGNAFARAARPWGDLPDDQGDLPYPVAVGLLAAQHAIDEDTAAAAFLQAFACNVISAAVRLVPLGQSAGLSVLAALTPTIRDVTERTRDASETDLGGACFRSDIAAMRHETQYTRLFRS